MSASFKFKLAALFATLAVGTLRAAAAEALPALSLPWTPGQTWYVCQGYNASISHQGMPAFDLSIDPHSPGGTGCTGNLNASVGQAVRAPAAGIVLQISGYRGPDFICISFDGGGSAAIGHLVNRVASQTHVSAGQRIGDVEAANYNNGGVAHIHLQVHSGAGCAPSPKVAFDDAHQAHFACAPNLPYSGVVNQYSGLALTACLPRPQSGSSWVETSLGSSFSGPQQWSDTI